MGAYLDVGVVRIQSYIARTPDLRLRRGASWLLSQETSTSAIEAWSEGFPGVEINDDAGEADGVVHLRVPAGEERTIAESLLLHLRQRLPGAELQAMWASGDSYPEARSRMPAGTGAETDESAGRMEGLPPLQDFPLAETCEKCRVDIRVAGALCADCHARDQAAGRRTADGQADDAIGTEREILAKVNRATGRELRVVRHFQELAELGSADGDVGNHLATVALDGNGLGAFFSALDGHLKKTMSRAVAETTRHALVQAVLGVVRDGDECLPVVPHVVGGDDVVVTVVADRALPFTQMFLANFATEMARRADHPGVRVPSISAGVVFAHQKFPYARAVQLAEETLRRAKRDTHGLEAAVAWLDVTADGEHPPDWRRTLTLKEIDDLREPLGALAAIGKSGRQALAVRLAAGGEEAKAAALVWARRNGHGVVTELLDRLSVSEVRNLVSLTRWWRV